LVHNGPNLFPFFGGQDWLDTDWHIRAVFQASHSSLLKIVNDIAHCLAGTA
jgi:hypothetical protein